MTDVERGFSGAQELEPEPTRRAAQAFERGIAFVVVGADLLGHLGLHQRLREKPHALAQEVDVAVVGVAY